MKTLQINTKQMVKTALIAVFLSAFLNVQADPRKDVDQTNTSAVINQMIDYPSQLIDIENSERVNVTFKVDSNNLIRVITVNGSDDRLEDYVKDQLNGKKANKLQVEHGKNYRVNINFRLL